MGDKSAKLVSQHKREQEEALGAPLGPDSTHHGPLAWTFPGYFAFILASNLRKINTRVPKLGLVGKINYLYPHKSALYRDDFTKK